jgi:hypothetical protein
MSDQYVRVPRDLLERLISATKVARGEGSPTQRDAKALLAAPAEDVRAAVDEPEPFIVGNQYRTQNGDLVRFVEIHNAGKSHETIRDEFGHHRYTQKSHLIGRVTGSAHDFSHPGNVPPLYRHPQRPVEELNK